jgi:hypothetical protein
VGSSDSCTSCATGGRIYGVTRSSSKLTTTLKFFLDQRLSTIPQHQWTSKLLGFDFHIEFNLGATKVMVDPLSHHDTEEVGETMALP